MAYPEGNIKNIVTSLTNFGITNPNVQAGILATSFKETGLKPVSEFSYMKTPADRKSPPGLRQIFPSRLGNLTNDEIDALKVDNVRFFDKIYGGMLGNDQPGDGYKYRGRGFNQITGKAQYKNYGELLGYDLLNNPDLMNDPQVAADALALYFKTVFNSGIKSGYLQKKIGVNDPSEIKDYATGTKLAIQANAGWKTNFDGPVVQAGYKKALANVNELGKFTIVTPLDIITAPLETVTKQFKKKRFVKVSSLRELRDYCSEVRTT